jgi:hypothetical protein
VDQKRYRTGSGAVAEDQEWQEAQVQEAEEKVDIETGRAGAINTHAPLTTITCLGGNDGCHSRYPVLFIRATHSAFPEGTHLRVFVSS